MHATQITEVETAGLTLGPLAATYPPVAESLVARTRDGRLPIDNWIYSQFTRYCPRCLAGDGSPVQRWHGGPWKIWWRLPVVFCCLEHQVFLEDRCSGCRLPAHAAHPGSVSRILPAPSRTGLHPAQCRNPDPEAQSEPGVGRWTRLCGTRLDAASPAPLRPAAADLALQGKLFGLLQTRHDAAEAFQVFADLRILAAVIGATWPRGEQVRRPLSPAHPCSKPLLLSAA